MSERLQELLRTAERVQREVQAFEHARATVREDAEGSDRRSAVTVVLDPDGRVRTVRPAAQWADRVPAEELGSAVFEAVQIAQGRRLERWVEAAEQAEPTSSTPERRSAEAPLIDLPAMVGELLRMFDGIGALSRVPATQEQPEPDTDSVGRVPVRVVLDRAGEPSEVQVSARWASAHSGDALGRRLTAAFEEAYETYDSAPAAADAGAGQARPSADLAAVLADPAGVLTRYTQSIRDGRGSSAASQ